ncbi:hypothetical protein HPB50_001173 [Hyalomma asiaticum]|uniref:Uncharacterized protein n=1 Tax=Hyalomma asiaticum TaxID=266040 RepID=A0ACB7RQ93_HYAAI|nr:hypothetical protein HPB50_001173 [Hyalomma asiaticum]
MFNVYLLASRAAEFKPERRKAILLHCLGAEGQRIYQTLHAGTSATAPAAPSAAAPADDKPVAALPDEYDSALTTLRHQAISLRQRPAVSCRAAVAFSQHAFAVSWHTAAVVHEPIDSAPSKAADPGAPATSVAQ